MCVEGTCLSGRSCDARSFDCLGSRGFCSAECTSDAECGAGHCVNTGCPADAPELCFARCLPSCDGGCAGPAAARCRELPDVGGALVSVCDPRNADGERCISDEQCISNECSGEFRCIAAGGSRNGLSCSQPSDCASGNCQSGTCRGTALRGDPCGTNADCSVGLCSAGICD